MRHKKKKHVRFEPSHVRLKLNRLLLGDNNGGEESFHMQDKKLFHLKEVHGRNVKGGRGQFSVDEVPVI